MLTLSQALQKRAYGIAWRAAAKDAIARGARFHFLPL